MNKIVVSIFAVLLASISTAHADNPWSLHYNGSSCQPDPKSVPLMQVEGGAVSFAPGEIGTITLSCAYSHEPGGTSTSAFELYYSDSQLDSGKAHTYVSALFTLMAKYDDSTAIIAISSSQDGVQDGKFWMHSVPFVHTFAGSNASAYYVTVVLHRDDPSQQARFYGIAVR